ncbi:hypothetical protein LAZ67_X004421 [Cordylochernes scorpioides]|uniref:Integrase p58-like C-terminal domain-containing protein n=1 Tax=Cordylochernes scorpioides TaxID=51811 RepID=A0ABY6LVE1_9ARAC|nr:hypothetical protein LAZ67_X004421 [Cordylochernes scorpioides]
MTISRPSDWKIVGGHGQTRKPTDLLLTRGNEEVPEKTQERMKRNYDKKHNEKIYEPGHLVAVCRPVRKIGNCEKLLRKYFGPYRILKKLSNVNYLIEPKDNPGQHPLIVHVSRLKPYFERIDELLPYGSCDPQLSIIVDTDMDLMCFCQGFHRSLGTLSLVPLRPFSCGVKSGFVVVSSIGTSSSSREVLALARRWNSGVSLRKCRSLTHGFKFFSAIFSLFSLTYPASPPKCHVEN